MCTVSLIPVEGGYRLLHSRDELRARSPGAPPSELAVGDRRAIAPRDPDAGGTWLALRCDGATFAITNVNPEPAPSKPHAPISRGSLVDGMLALEPEPGAVGPWVRSRDLMRLACFRAILVEPAGRAWSWVWDGASLAEETTGEMGPVVWVSSGLGDSKVEPRVPLFASMLAADPTPERQDAFHRHIWEDRPEISVLMAREDARTVSIASAERVRDRLSMDYREIHDHPERRTDRPGPAGDLVRVVLA